MFKQKGSRINVRSEENGRGVVFSAELACLPFRIPLPVPPLVRIQNCKTKSTKRRKETSEGWQRAAVQGTALDTAIVYSKWATQKAGGLSSPVILRLVL